MEACFFFPAAKLSMQPDKPRSTNDKQIILFIIKIFLIKHLEDKHVKVQSLFDLPFALCFRFSGKS